MAQVISCRIYDNPPPKKSCSSPSTKELHYIDIGTGNPLHRRHQLLSVVTIKCMRSKPVPLNIFDSELDITRMDDYGYSNKILRRANLHQSSGSNLLSSITYLPPIMHPTFGILLQAINTYLDIIKWPKRC